MVVDEVHIVGEGRRGATLETLLCKLLLAPVSPRVVAMSATIGNVDELSVFLKVSLFHHIFFQFKTYILLNFRQIFTLKISDR